MVTASTRRGPVRRMLDVWGFVPGFAADHEPVWFSTREGIRLAATYLPGPASRQPAARVPAVVLAHGFGAHHRKPAYAFLAEQLAGQAAVLAVDLRGHGRSQGRSTLGDREVLDLGSAAAWLRARGHGWVAVVGASMGGTAALRAAGTGPPGLFDAVCSISAPAVWGLTDTRALRRLSWAVGGRCRRRLTGVWLRVRLAPGGWPRGARAWATWGGPARPLDLVARIAPTPLLLVHGQDDHFYGVSQAEALHARAGGTAVLWREPPGFGHAEDGFTAEFADRLARALRTVRHTGRWPQRAAAVARQPAAAPAGPAAAVAPAAPAGPAAAPAPAGPAAATAPAAPRPGR